MHGVFVDRIAGIAFGERYELDEHAFPAHAELFAEALRRCVVVFNISIDPAEVSLSEKMIEKGPCGFERVTLAAELWVEVPADRGGLGVVLLFGAAAEKIADDLTGLFQANRKAARVECAFLDSDFRRGEVSERLREEADGGRRMQTKPLIGWRAVRWRD